MVVAAEQQLVDRVAAAVRERGVGPAVEARCGGDGARVAHGQGMGFAARIQPRATAGAPPGHARPGLAMTPVPPLTVTCDPAPQTRFLRTPRLATALGRGVARRKKT